MWLLVSKSRLDAGWVVHQARAQLCGHILLLNPEPVMVTQNEAV